MTTGRRVMLFAVLACALASAGAWGMPRGIKAGYQGYMNGIPIGVINEHFEADGQTYRIESDTKATGIAALFQRQPLKFLSSGQMTREGLKPMQFEGRRAANESPQVSAKFDWESGQLFLQHDGKSETFPVSNGTQDRLSIMYQLMIWPIARMANLEFALTNGRKLDTYRYRVNADVELATPLGRLKTLHLVKQRNPGDSGTEIWLSPQHHYFPVKVVYIERDGVRFEQLIQTLEIRD
jgi:hypothetical protein